MSRLTPCDEWAEAISAYADGELPGTGRRALEAHLAGCETCRRWLEAVRADQRSYAEAYAAQLPDRAYVDRVVAALPAKQEAPVRRGFTLVEYGVVGAILVVVAAILFPVQSRIPHAREKSRQTACLSNVKQLVLAFQMYAGDHGDRLPLADSWVSAVWPYAKNRGLFVCPTDRKGSTLSYAMPWSMSEAKLGDIPEPERTPIVYDADGSGAFAPRHNGGGNVGFADGHAKWYATPPEGVKVGGALGQPERNYGLAERLRLTYNAGAQIETLDVLAATERARTIIAEQQGFVLDASYADAGSRPTARLSFRAPTSRLDVTLQALCRLGRVLGWQLSGQDVTAQVMAAEAKLRVQAGDLARAETAAMRPRASQANRETVASEERKTTEVRGEAYAQHARTALATVSATFTSPVAHVSPWSATTRAATRGWDCSMRVVGQAAAWAGSLFPLWLPLVLAGLALRFLRRRALSGARA
jgi:prepilin-type processing-associated H-X9-DG protein